MSDELTEQQKLARKLHAEWQAKQDADHAAKLAQLPAGTYSYGYKLSRAEARRAWGGSGHGSRLKLDRRHQRRASSAARPSSA